MNVIKVSAYGDAAVLKLTAAEPKPMPGPGQVLVKIHAAGVNFVDIYQRRGIYPVPVPYIPGLEASGVVEACGERVTNVRPGDRVAYTGHLGSYSEYTVIDADKLISLPRELTFEQGAAFPLQGMTAHYLIHDFRKPGPGDTVLVHAAAGGVGLLLVQWGCCWCSGRNISAPRSSARSPLNRRRVRPGQQGPIMLSSTQKMIL